MNCFCRRVLSSPRPELGLVPHTVEVLLSCLSLWVPALLAGLLDPGLVFGLPRRAVPFGSACRGSPPFAPLRWALAVLGLPGLATCSAFPPAGRFALELSFGDSPQEFAPSLDGSCCSAKVSVLHSGCPLSHLPPPFPWTWVGAAQSGLRTSLVIFACLCCSTPWIRLAGSCATRLDSESSI